MILAEVDYPLLNLFWTTLVIFCWVLWFMLLFRVYGDLFSRQDIGGWAKTGWVVLTLFMPFLGVFLYLISQGRGMADDVLRTRRTRRLRRDCLTSALPLRPPRPCGEQAYFR